VSQICIAESRENPPGFLWSTGGAPRRPLCQYALTNLYP